MDQTVRQKISWPHLLLALVVGWMLATAPIREVRAAIPALAAGLGLFIKTPLGKSVMASLALHAAVLAVEFHNTSSATPPGTDADKKLEVKLNPKDPMTTPAGWTAPSGGNPEPTPPATTTQGGAGRVAPSLWKYYTSNTFVTNGPGTLSPASGYVTSNSAMVCAGAVAGPWSFDTASGQWVATETCGNGTVTVNRYTATTGGTCPGGSTFTTSGVNAGYCVAAATCPTGYVVSGSSCALSDASVVQKPADGKAEIRRSGNVFYTDARDTADGLPPGVTVATDKVTAVSNDGQKTVTATIAADGSTKVVETVARTDGSGLTDVRTTGMSAPNASTGAVEVTGTKVETFSGTGSQQTTEKPTFPSDYSKTGEAQTAGDSIVATLGPKLDKITETGADPGDPLQPQGSEFDQAFFNGTFNNLLGWQVPAHSSQCPTSSFDWNGQAYTINSHCQMVADHFSGLSAVMSVVWTIVALFILLGA